MEPRKRACIVGTADTWRRTPWQDAGMFVVSLNDAYSLGLPRADAWYEQHPFGKMWFRPLHQTVIHPKDVPKGAYIRPEGHLDWLKTQATAIPVYLQDTPPVDWPVNAHRFPIEAITKAFGESYWASGPSYILAHLVMQGFTEIWITGIHLSTEHEYREQRPQFENLIGRLLGAHVTETKTEDGWRIYDGAIRIVLPVETPLLQHGWRYAYDPKPTAPANPYMEELVRTQKQKAKLVKALVNWPTGQDKREALAQLEDLEVIEFDCQQMLARRSGFGTLAAKLPMVLGA